MERTCREAMWSGRGLRTRGNKRERQTEREGVGRDRPRHPGISAMPEIEHSLPGARPVHETPW